MSKTQQDRKLNCLGLYCPEPIIKTRIELDKMKAGEILEVIADDPAAEEDIKSLIKRLNHQLISFRKEEDKLYFLIKKT
ncbi:MAG: sulfurtransferase TusA family protein [Candidatus Bathyarchaeia archaeon]